MCKEEKLNMAFENRWEPVIGSPVHMPFGQFKPGTQQPPEALAKTQFISPC